MEQEYKEINLENLANGAAEELFQRELKEVVKNITDPNTDPKEVRKIVLTIAIQPDEKREMAAMNIKCSAKLAGIKPAGTIMYIAKQGDLAKAFQHNFKQTSFLDKDDNVVDFKQEAGNDKGSN